MKDLGINKDKNILIFASIFVFVVACTIYTVFFSKDRENMTKINDLIFNETVFDVKSTSKSGTLAEIDLTELYMIGVDNKFEILIQDDQNDKIKSKIKEGNTREEETGGMILETEYTVAFSYPKDTDYIKATITKGNDKKSFTIDIRDFK